MKSKSRGCVCSCDFNNDLWDICVCECKCVSHRIITLDREWEEKRLAKMKFVRRRR